jgi:hypothetical protein
MPAGEGWFIDLATGEAISIQEHQTAVKADPARFRVTPGEVEKSDRDVVLGLVYSRGFVRVRADEDWVVAEFDAEESAALPAIRGFFEQKGLAGGPHVCLHDHRLGRTLHCTVQRFIDGQVGPSDWQEWEAVRAERTTEPDKT